MGFPSFLYARQTSHETYVVRSCSSKEQKKRNTLVKAWMLTLLVSVNALNVPNPALKPALYCRCSGCHSKGVSTDELPNVSVQSWVGCFAADRVKAPLLPITSRNWMHTGYRTAPGTVVWTCLEGSAWDHHLWLHSECAVRHFSWAEMGSLYSFICKRNVSSCFTTKNRYWHDSLVLHRLIFPQAMLPELLFPPVCPQKESLIITKKPPVVIITYR